MDIHALINSANKSDRIGRGAKVSFWRPQATGVSPFRPYRFGEKKELYAERHVHWIDGRPYDCTGEGCQFCESCKRLYDAKDEDSRKRANAMKRTTMFVFIGANPNTPTEFLMWEAYYSTGKDVVLQVAQVAGWIEGWPKADNPSKVAEFLTFFARGCDEVCGPKGFDLLIDYEKGRKPAVKVSFSRFKGKELAVPEGDNVPHPIETRQKIDAAVAAKKTKNEAEARSVLADGQLPS